MSPARTITKQCPIENITSSKIAQINCVSAKFKTTPSTGARNAKVQGPRANPKTKPKIKAEMSPVFLVALILKLKFSGIISSKYSPNTKNTNATILVPHGPISPISRPIAAVKNPIPAIVIRIPTENIKEIINGRFLSISFSLFRYPIRRGILERWQGLSTTLLTPHKNELNNEIKIESDNAEYKKVNKSLIIFSGHFFNI